MLAAPADLRSVWASIKAAFARWLGRARAAPAPQPAAPPLLLTFDPAPAAPTPPAAPAPRAKTRPAAPDGDASEAFGHFYFKDTILDQLDGYRHYVKRMRKIDPDTYELYKRIGAVVVPHRTWASAGTDGLSKRWLEVMPGFGCVALVGSDLEKAQQKTGFIHPKILSFRKYTKPPTQVQRMAAGQMYVVGVYFDDRGHGPERWGHGAGVQFPIQVLPDGEIVVLRKLVDQSQTIRHRHGAYRGRESVVHHSRWGVGQEVQDWAMDNSRPVADMLREVFARTAETHAASATTMIRIAATKGGITAAFSIDPLRTPYFFDDRDVVLAKSGRKKPIFHVVRPHVRVLANGRKVPVKLHFAGLRSFSWNGHEVLITVPGKHHADLAEVAIGSLDFEDGEPVPPNMVDVAGLGDYLSAHIQGERRPGRASVRDGVG
jgi:hypothetical protein